MEEQSTPQPILNQVAPISSISSKQKNYTLLIIVILVFLLMAGGLAFLGYQNYQLQQQLDHLILQQSESAIESSAPVSETPSTKITLAESLSKYCLDDKIKLENLPFTLNQTLKAEYNVKDTITCIVPEESSASISLQLNTPDFTGDVRRVYFFHQNSKSMGMLDYFQPLSNYKTINIDNQNYSATILEPGPYGISTHGIWFNLIGEKQDLATGTIVRVINLEILKDQQFIDLVKKYGSEVTDVEGKTIYVVNDPGKKTQFTNEVLDLSSKSSIIKVSAKNISTDLDGISF